MVRATARTCTAGAHKQVQAGTGQDTHLLPIVHRCRLQVAIDPLNPHTADQASRAMNTLPVGPISSAEETSQADSTIMAAATKRPAVAALVAATQGGAAAIISTEVATERRTSAEEEEEDTLAAEGILAA